MGWSRSWAALMVLGLVVVCGGSAHATGSGFGRFGSHGERYGGGGGLPVDDVYTSGDGTLGCESELEGAND